MNKDIIKPISYLDNFKNTTIEILGTEYKIVYENFQDNPDFKRNTACGFCDRIVKVITICNIKSNPDYYNITDDYAIKYMKEVLRHEITHAFLSESGLAEDSHASGCGWAVDEEIVDWIAIQSPKIYKIFKRLELLNEE